MIEKKCWNYGCEYRDKATGTCSESVEIADRCSEWMGPDDDSDYKRW